MNEKITKALMIGSVGGMLGLGIANGLEAVNTNTESVKAETIGEVLESWNDSRAPEYQACADSLVDRRDRLLIVAASDTVAATGLGMAVASLNAGNRKRRQA